MTPLLLLAALVVLGLLLWLTGQRGARRARQAMALYMIFAVVAAHLIARLSFPGGPWWAPWALNRSADENYMVSSAGYVGFTWVSV